MTSANGGSATAGQTSTINMKEGENWTCTYLNSLRNGTLRVIKHVINDNGGTNAAADWSIHVKSGANEVTGSPQPGSETGTDYFLPAGTYTASETGAPSGYNFDGFSGACDAGGSVTVVAGQTATCTLTNDDDAPALHLRKVVVNDNGGTKTVADFPLLADGTGANDVSGTSPADSGAGLDADTFALSETGQAGYTASAWSCVKNGGAPVTGSSVTLGLGDTATCTITNDDDAPALHLRKVVVNDNGGTKTVADFPLLADGTGANDVSGTSPADSGAGLDADTFALSETGQAGYTASAWSCVKNGGAPVTGSSVTLGLGDTATCTITNDDDAPALHLRKVVVNDNGGTKTVADFPLLADGTGANDVSGTSPADSGAGLDADTFALSETGQAGYTASAWSCVKNGGAPVTGSSVTLGLGDTATCTITNDDDAPALHLRKSSSTTTVARRRWRTSAAG